MTTRSLVIGATGFIGRHILRTLRDAGHSATATRRWNSDAGLLRRLGADADVCDVMDRDDVHRAVAGYNYVFYAAAPRPELDGDDYTRHSVIAMRNVLAAARAQDVDRLIVTSCATTFGQPVGRHATADDVYLPGTSGDTRIEAQYAVERECYREAADNLDLLIVCPTLCIGDGALLPSRRAMADVGDDARTNVVDVARVARAHAEALSVDLERTAMRGQRIAVAGEDVTVAELYARLGTEGDGPASLHGFAIELIDDAEASRASSLIRHGAWVDDARSRNLLDEAVHGAPTSI